MNDDFLHRLRVQPPLEFTMRLATNLQVLPESPRSARRFRIRRAWPALALLAGAAFAAASPAVRTIVSHAWSTLFTAHSNSVPAEAPEAVLAAIPKSASEGAPAVPAQAPAQPPVSSNLTSPASGDTALAQARTLPAGSESSGPQPDVPGVPNMSCGDAYSPRWDNCVGLERFENGNIYRGEFHHGLREGLGFLIVNATGESDHNNIRFNNGPIRSNDGSPIYAGEFRGGLLNGHGVWFTKSGAGYSGTFIDNIAQSDVSQRNCSGALSPSWSNCVARTSYEDGNVYYGEFMNGRREGIGMLEIHETGTSDETSIRTPAAGYYVGEFSGDRLNGQGMIFMPGAGFYGTFTNNVLDAARPGN
jgi:hypothetical protein